MERFHLSGHGVLSGMCAMIRSNLNVLPKEPNLFENPDTAKYVLQVFLSINNQMIQSIRAVEHKTSREEYKAFRRGVGHVTYEVFERIVEPICKRHPSLRPPEMKAFHRDQHLRLPCLDVAARRRTLRLTSGAVIAKRI